MKGFWQQIGIAIAAGCAAIGLIYALHGNRIDDYAPIAVAGSIEAVMVAGGDWYKPVTGLLIMIAAIALSLFGFLRGMARLMWFKHRQTKATLGPSTDARFLSGIGGRLYQSWLHLKDDGTAR